MATEELENMDYVKYSAFSCYECFSDQLQVQASLAETDSARTDNGPT